jgi:hypothetical protein
MLPVVRASKIPAKGKGRAGRNCTRDSPAARIRTLATATAISKSFLNWVRLVVGMVGKIGIFGNYGLVKGDAGRAEIIQERESVSGINTKTRARFMMAIVTYLCSNSQFVNKLRS